VGKFLKKVQAVSIHPSGTAKDMRGMPASHDMRATPKNYGKRTIVGVIRNGKYVNPDTNEPIVISNKKLKKAMKVRINKIGGIE